MEELVPIIVFTMPNARLKYLADKLFQNTLNQRKDKRVREVTLIDKLGTLISFRKNYIINGQLYKLISYDFDPTTKQVTAQLILK